MENYLKWKKYKDVRKYLLTECNGILFGGCIRDEILHDEHAKLFYKCDHPKLDYYNSAVEPNLSGRFVIPIDIDVILTQINFVKLITHYTKWYNLTFTPSKWSQSSYFDRKFKNKINHYKVRISNVKNVDIDLDILVINDPELSPPFFKPDFSVNCLLSNAIGEYSVMNGIKLSVDEIKTQIINKETYSYTTSEYRTVKITNKKFNITKYIDLNKQIDIWSELIGVDINIAVESLKKEYPDLNIVPLPYNNFVLSTFDKICEKRELEGYNKRRNYIKENIVVVLYDDNNKVLGIPKRG